jgi:hypothetical protein
MKISLHDNSTRVFLLATIALSASLWKIFFFYGAYGEIFFEYIYTIVFISTAIFVAYFFLPRSERPFGIGSAFLFLIPSIWFVTAYIDILSDLPGVTLVANIMEWIVLLFSLPYIFYFLLSITQAETLELKPKRLLAVLIAIALVTACAGYLLGKHNNLFLYCRDFKISGMETPLQCYSLKEQKLIE